MFKHDITERVVASPLDAALTVTMRPVARSAVMQKGKVLSFLATHPTRTKVVHLKPIPFDKGRSSVEFKSDRYLVINRLLLLALDEGVKNKIIHNKSNCRTRSYASVAPSRYRPTQRHASIILLYLWAFRAAL